MRRLMLMLVTAWALASAGVAAAVPGPWSDPVNLSADGANASQPRVAVAPGGTTTAVWVRDGVIEQRTRPTGGVFGATEPLSQAGAASPQVAVAPDGTITAVWVRDGVIEQRTRPTGGVFGAVEPLSQADATYPQVAFGPDGTTTVAWQRDLNKIEQRTRLPGNDFGAVQLVSQDNGSFPLDRGTQVAFGPDGTTTMVWQRHNPSESQFPVSQATRAAGGSTFGPEQPLSGSGSVSGPQVAFGPGGSTTVVWVRNNIIEQRTRPPGGDFGDVEGVSTSSPVGDPQVAFGPDGTTIIVWKGDDGDGNDIIEQSTRPSGGTFGAVEPLSDAGTGPSSLDARGPQVAIGSDGTTIVVWRQNNQVGIRQRTRPAGSSNFGDAVDLSGAGQDADEPQVAFSAGGTATAIWYRSNGTNDIIQAAFTENRVFARPVITGTPVPGQTVSCEGARFSDASAVQAPVWRRAGQQAGTGVGYTITESDRGGTLTCTVRATNSFGFVDATSDPVSVPAAQQPPQPPPAIQPPAAAPFACSLPRRPKALSLPATVGQLRTNQRIGVAAVRRLNAINARLAGKPVPRPSTKRSKPIRPTTGQLRINQRISEAGYRRARILYVSLGGQGAPAPTSRARTLVFNRRGVGFNQLTNIRTLDLLNCINRNL